jgi:uncharacterized protein (DUF1800 family)
MSLSPELLATRFGYGLPLPAMAPTDPQAMVQRLSGPDAAAQAWPLPGLAETLPQIRQVQMLKKALKTGADDKPFKEAVAVLDDQVIQASKVTMARRLDSADPFRERLVAFWTNHFCTRAKDRPMVTLPHQLVDEAIRPNLTGRFADLLIAVTTHPAMILYLDQNTSYGPDSQRGLKLGRGLNENLAREVMELHSLGLNANYTQTDVRQMAELLTGLTFNTENGSVFDRLRVEPGDETVLGTRYPGGMDSIRAVLTDLADRPETATHIATKLARHFVSDIPPGSLVTALTRAYRDSGGSLIAVYAALLDHPAAADPTLGKVRWPADYIPTAMRAMGLTGAALMAMNPGPARRAVVKGQAQMGMPFWQPPGPNGFSEAAEDWINPPYLAARIAWALTVPQTLVDSLPDPMALAQSALGARADQTLLTAVGRAETRREAVGLVLASTEMNRR